MTLVNLSDAERFVSKTRNARWDGWDIVFFRPHPNGYTSPQGVFYRGRWGFQHRVSPSRRGWEIPKRYAV